MRSWHFHPQPPPGIQNTVSQVASGHPNLGLPSPRGLGTAFGLHVRYAIHMHPAHARKVKPPIHMRFGMFGGRACDFNCTQVPSGLAPRSDRTPPPQLCPSPSLKGRHLGG